MSMKLGYKFTVGKLLIVGLIFIFIIIPLINNPVHSQTPSPWHESSRKYRVKLAINPAIQIANGTPIETTINFSQLLQSAGGSGVVNLSSLKLVEVNSQGAMVNASVPFQFDGQANSSGKFIFMSPDIPTGTNKNYYLYFDTGSNFSLPAFTPQVGVTDNVSYQGQSSFRFTTSTGTYYYHKAGAGFAGMLDKDGVDWISYRPTGGSAGNFRGIPNMVHPEGFFHPGSTGSTSQIISQGPLKAIISSTNGNWSGIWEIYPTFARMTLSSVGHSYWFLYEGTPNGVFNASTNFMILSSGERYTANQEWTRDLSSPEWIYFSDTSKNRSLFLSHLEDDTKIDSYKQMQDNMTVFGFGRDGTSKHLTATPSRFLVGFIESNVYANAAKMINSYSRITNAALSSVEIRSNNITPSVTPTVTPTATASPTPTNTPPPPPPTATIAPGATVLNSTVFLHGIGQGGDNTSASSLGNMNPLHTTRAVTVEAYNASNQLVATKQGNILFNSTNGDFTGSIDMGQLVTGIYIIKIKVPQYLKKPIQGIVTITSGQVNTLSPLALTTGDINNDNQLSALDYNLLLDCFSDLAPPRNCSDQSKKDTADITDDGRVSQFDYNLFLRELSTQQGQ